MIAMEDLKRETDSLVVLGYTQLRGDLNTNDFEVAEGMQRCIMDLSNRIEQGQASPLAVQLSVDNIRDALTVFNRHLNALKTQPDQTIDAAGGTTTNRVFFLGAPGPGNTVNNFEIMLKQIEEAADYFEEKVGEIQRKRDCNFLLKGVGLATAVSTAVFAASYFYSWN